MSSSRLSLLCFALLTLAPRASAQSSPPVAGPPLGVTGVVRFHGDFPSQHVAKRNVEVWLPPGYERSATTRYPVLYMHDGQNVFDPATAYVKVDWAVDEVMTDLVARGKVRPAIVVAVWNTPARMQEYMPGKPLASDTLIPSGMSGVAAFRGKVVSDRYLRFLVEELKPFIDRTYRTKPGPEDTFVMGSSMGGLISAYAMIEYPQVFGGAGCVSTAWQVGGGVTIPYLKEHLPAPASHRFWFDHGTMTMDSTIAPYQRQVDAIVRAGGYVDGKNLATRTYPGAEHSERAWRVRVQEPLVFLLGPPRAGPASGATATASGPRPGHRSR